jgi:hypothetical protein
MNVWVRGAGSASVAAGGRGQAGRNHGDAARQLLKGQDVAALAAGCYRSAISIRLPRQSADRCVLSHLGVAYLGVFLVQWLDHVDLLVTTIRQKWDGHQGQCRDIGVTNRVPPTAAAPV